MEQVPAHAHPYAAAHDDGHTIYPEWERTVPEASPSQIDDMFTPIVQDALAVLCGTAPPPLLPRDPRQLLPRVPFVNVRNLCFINASLQARPC